MTTIDSPALQIALAYYDAWRNRDHAAAMNFVADNVVADTPFGRLDGGTALHESETQFAPMLTGATMIANYGDETTALLLYDTHTSVVPSNLSAKYFVVEDGKITSMKGVFDTSVFTSSESDSQNQ
jgi:ketosteroid isomerase-like protein